MAVYLAFALLVVDAALVVLNWSLRPDRATAWILSSVFLAVMAIAALWWRRDKSIHHSVILASLIIAGALGGRLGIALGATYDMDLPKRFMMSLIGVFFVFTGNGIPKKLPSLANKRADPARLQAAYRFSGWTWVVVGLLVTLAWLLLPLPIAEASTFIVIAAGVLTVVSQIFVLRRSGDAAC